jgi:vacuolar protein sorting-associated protein 13A/C
LLTVDERAQTMTIHQIVMNHKLDKNTPHFDVQLLFDEIGVALDDNQYRDAISLVDMYHVYMRQRQVKSFEARRS